MAQARWSDRIAGVIFLALAIWLYVEAGSYAVRFGDPAGPSFFPRLVAVPMGLLALVLILRPDADPTWFRWPQILSQAAMLAVLFGYPLAIEPLGFPLSTLIASALLAKILGATWLQALALGAGLGFGLFFLFDAVFGLPLPTGPLLG
ncbi:tripartite tricarboxylate transporter TctB family protein [Salinarimonas ramus]|uniref:DUF1468 domain-containing protein n=1 Tax=Salinarimonas ramus TaxID=690164 RepID=A0A917Q446_9HYPH|nr:tripartite tricarboxylate transporter TctB family protein [Salinarimonas ramus]GGK21181.1 hypothetical protein GCM10011322_04790 [Salinarimonas ramus]